MTIHNFNESLQKSFAYEDWIGWERIYKVAFGEGYSMTNTRGNMELQQNGIDRIITLKHGKIITVDEKVRPTWLGKDIALETYSSVNSKSPGWVCKPLHCDFIAYALIAQSICYLLPVIQLQQAWQNCGEEWTLEYGIKNVNNGTYTTQFVPVPVNVLYQKIGSALRIDFDNTDFADGIYGN